MNSYPRETVEFQPITVKVDGVAVTTGVQFAVIHDGHRPSNWLTPVSIEGKIGIMVEGLPPGSWRVWAKVTSNPEAPVIDCGFFLVT